jgi:hypothetical protein
LKQFLDLDPQSLILLCEDFNGVSRFFNFFLKLKTTNQ